MKRFKPHARSLVRWVFAVLFASLIGVANAERIFYDSFEVADSNGDPVGWQTAGHPSYLGVATEGGSWTTPYGSSGMTTYSSGVGTRTIGFLPEGSGNYTVNFNITSSAAKGEYRAELWAIDWINGPMLVGHAVGDTDGSKNMSFSGQITWRYNYVPNSTMDGAELQLKLMQDPLRGDWRNTPIWDNVSVDWVPDVDTTGPAVVDITDNNGGGSVVATNALVTYTVTFNEPMLAATVGISDFGNAASADVTVESVTTTANNAVFLVGVRPTTGGTLRLKIAQNAVLQDASGNPMNTSSQFDDNVTFLVQAGTPILLPTNIVDNRGGSPCAANTPVTYTLTFSKDMNSSTVSAADFGNAGYAPITIGTPTETSPGVFTVLVTPTGSGTLQFRVNPGVDIRAADGGILDATSGIADNTTIIVDSDPPVLDDITDDTGGSPVAVDTPITYDVFFNEDMDASTVEASDFGNAVTVGNAPFTIHSVEQSSPGVFRIELTPTGDGAIQLQINAGAVLADKIGNALVTTSAIIDDSIVTVGAATNEYDQWSGGAAFAVDGNGDGVGNGLAWLLGAADPSENALDLLPAPANQSGNLVLTFTCLNPSARGGASLRVEYSNDLAADGGWLGADVPEEDSVVDGVTFDISTNPDPDLMGVQAIIPASAALPGTSLFGRLKATAPPP